MNTKQKIYDLKAQQKALLEKMKGMEPAGEEYAQCEKDFDAMQSKVEALEKQLQREEKLGVDDEGDPDHMKGFNPRGADPTEKVFQGSGVLKGLKLDSIKAFADGVRKAMTEGTASAGGYTVPVDIVSRIFTLIEEQDSLLPYITSTGVTTNTGARTFKTRAQHQGFSTVLETAAISNIAQPTFGQVEFIIRKRAGYLPVTVELLEDSDVNITAIVMQWMADEYRVTVNKKTVEVIKPETSSGVTAISGLDDILKVLTTGLGSGLRAVSTIHTNDSGLLYLSTLKDSTGRPMLQPDPTQPTRMVLCVGAVAVPIKVWDNATITPVTEGNIPFAIGSLQEAVWRFYRRELTVERLTEATLGDINLAEQDMVAFKATMRDDYQLRDAKAVKWCEVTPVTDSEEGGEAND